uniref:Uncharacterized protein n=1 Tax=Pipistrellus kuhlii TaxID=59472 RepID=A0A7J7Y959_PIPKU|nr:hypothetical protein mPipKuh1_010320 [Pipistrellus kuhlii]
MGEKVSQEVPGIIPPPRGPLMGPGTLGWTHQAAIIKPVSVQHYIFPSTLVSRLMWAPHSFSEAYLHVMHIYDAFFTTHRIPTAVPTAAGKLGFRGSDPLCLASPSFSLNRGSQESQPVLSSNPSSALHLAERHWVGSCPILSPRFLTCQMVLRVPPLPWLGGFVG